MDRRKSWSSQITNQILYWLVGMKDIRYINPQPSFLNKPPTNSASVDAQIGSRVFHLPLIFPSTAATLLINSISSLAFCNFGKACYWEKSLNIGKPLFAREPCFAAKGPKVPTQKNNEWLLVKRTGDSTSDFILRKWVFQIFSDVLMW